MARFLQEERKRLGFNQSEVSENTGVSMTSQSYYETGKRFPDSQYLLKLAEMGFDINFVLTGQRDSNHLTNEEKFLLDKFRQASKEKQTAVLGALLFDGDSVAVSVAAQSAKAKDNHIGDISNSTIGDITQGSNNEQ